MWCGKLAIAKPLFTLNFNSLASLEQTTKTIYSLLEQCHRDKGHGRTINLKALPTRPAGKWMIAVSWAVCVTGLPMGPHCPNNGQINTDCSVVFTCIRILLGHHWTLHGPIGLNSLYSSVKNEREWDLIIPCLQVKKEAATVKFRPVSLHIYHLTTQNLIYSHA